ncbi:hypothetical protein JKA74_00490 [Marivirga sp. S37H4]|uniref:Uncharacterized protein n=1 Tax=Marivirga aurantiaca TaxID=2802615 RepID=A0A934WV45_9BACT|nr:hypothetical protein [Marivirga aurantiaca]MBK6263494.1 hypothetical protein [Marivirga aurantiaca]
METQIQKNTTPLSTKDWLITLIITAIPLIGFIMLLVWAFSSDTNVNKANWAKAALLLMVIFFVLGILFSLVFGVGMFALLNGNVN